MRQIFWHNKIPTCDEATFVVCWALDHAINCNPGGIKGPINIAVLKNNKIGTKNEMKAELINEITMEEHKCSLNGMIEYIRKYKHMNNETHDSTLPKPENS
ncbi:MAG: hypothetical protein JW866_11030 [Ignavibacteriales bacterium]|nr:hypothetical protein [Ignavibacteriales bacterium]